MSNPSSRFRHGLTPRNLSLRAIRALEGISLMAIFGTGELDLSIAAGMLALAGITHFVRRERQALLPNRILFYGLAALIASALAATRRWGIPPILSAAGSALGVMALTWTLEPSRRNIGWRMALSFLLVVIAAAMTPDFYLAGLIFLYVIIASLLLLTLFMDAEFERTGARELGRPVSGAFLGQALLLSALVFLLSLTLFPILPRSSPIIESLMQPGYSENVDLSSPGFGRTTNRSAAMRISAIDEKMDPEIWFTSLPSLLVRGRILDRFDGIRWYGSPLAVRSASGSSKTHGPAVLRVLRGPLQTELLHTFAGSTPILGAADRPEQLSRTRQGEWVFRHGYGREVYYRLTWPLPQVKEKELEATERAALLKVPPLRDTQDRELWLDLARRIGERPNPATRARILRDWFRSNEFSGELRNFSKEAEGQPARRASPDQAMRRLTDFLFRDRRGHCELFASSAVLLLRLAGTPARIATGFRISSPPVSGILTIREEDAHAWAEYWDDRARSWVSLDVTPSLSRSNLWDLGILRSLRDYLEGWWFRYVVASGDPARPSLRTDDDPLAARSWNRWRENFRITAEDWLRAATGALSLSAFSLLAFLLKRHLRRRSQIQTGLIDKSRRRDLRKIKRRFEKRGLTVPPLYDELRFGPTAPGTEQWRGDIQRLRALLSAPR